MSSIPNDNVSTDARSSRMNSLAADFFGADEAHPAATGSGPPPYTPYGHKVIYNQSDMSAVQEPRTLARLLFLYGFRECLDKNIFLSRQH